MTTITVAGHGEFHGTDAAIAHFDGMKKTELVRRIAQAYEGTTNSPAGVTHFRSFPKETLVVMAADMFAADVTEPTEPANVDAPVIAEPIVFVEHSQDTRPANSTLKLVQAEQPDAPAATQDAEPIAAPAGGYRIKCTLAGGWLRRDQPRKPGDQPKWTRVEDVKRASIYRSQRQAEVKLAEIASLYNDTDHAAALELIAPEAK